MKKVILLLMLGLIIITVGTCLSSMMGTFKSYGEENIDYRLEKYLNDKGIDKEKIRLLLDYKIKKNGIGSPYAKIYTDGEKNYAVIDCIPRVNDEGKEIIARWYRLSEKMYESYENLIYILIDGGYMRMIYRGETYECNPIVYEGEEEYEAGEIKQLGLDEINNNYFGNIIELDYKICKRQIRLIEGKILSKWIFDKKIKEDIVIKYNQGKKEWLEFGIYKNDGDSEIITVKRFEEIVEEYGYPVIINDTYTGYPDADPETDTVDGQAGYESTQLTWANLRAQTGTNAYPSAVTNYSIQIRGGPSANNFDRLVRGIYLFETSSLGGVNITSAELSLYCPGKQDNLSTTPSINVYTSDPASNNNLVGSDFSTLGDVALSDTIEYGDISVGAYNEFELNEDGIEAINKEGITKLGVRDVEYDVGGTIPNWVYGGWSYIQIYGSEKGEGYQPTLVIEYDPIDPKSPEDLTLIDLGNTTVGANWTKGDDSVYTMLRVSRQGYVSDNQSGEMVYMDTGESCNITGSNVGYIPLYVTAWGLDSTGTIWSENATLAMIGGDSMDINLFGDLGTNTLILAGVGFVCLGLTIFIKGYLINIAGIVFMISSIILGADEVGYFGVGIAIISIIFIMNMWSIKYGKKGKNIG